MTCRKDHAIFARLHHHGHSFAVTWTIQCLLRDLAHTHLPLSTPVICLMASARSTLGTTPCYGPHNLRSDQVYQGAIVYLPSKMEVYANHHKGTGRQAQTVHVHAGSHQKMRAHIFNHPILIISRPATSSDEVHFLLVGVLSTQRRRHL